MDKIKMERPRDYIGRLRSDPRTKALFDSFVYQATVETRETFGKDPYDRPEEYAHRVAQRAVQLAMSFVLDHDREYLETREQMERLQQQVIQFAYLTTPKIILEQTPNVQADGNQGA